MTKNRRKKKHLFSSNYKNPPSRYIKNYLTKPRKLLSPKEPLMKWPHVLPQGTAEKRVTTNIHHSHSKPLGSTGTRMSSTLPAFAYFIQSLHRHWFWLVVNSCFLGLVLFLTQGLTIYTSWSLTFTPPA